MEVKSNLFAAARKAVGMSICEVAEAADLSDRAYSTHENKDNDMFRLGELKPIYKKGDEAARKLLMTAIEGFFLE